MAPTTDAAAHPGLTPTQKQRYEADGYVVVPGLFAVDECRAFIDHMMDLHAGRKRLEGFAPRRPDDWGRTHNQHLYDPEALRLLLHPGLRRPLEDTAGDAAEGVQTMYFWRGSQQRRHQDQYYLPACFSAWVALTDVGPENGTIYVQPGSHRGRLLTWEDFKKPDGEPAPLFGPHYDDALDALYAANATPEVPVVARGGDAVIFSGRLIHRGGEIQRPDAFRHVMANHYVPRAFKGWPHAHCPRLGFDGSSRGADGPDGA